MHNGDYDFTVDTNVEERGGFALTKSTVCPVNTKTVQ